jgi:hypothetical protein
MEDAFGTLVWVVVAVGAIVAVYTLIGTGSAYREIGSGGIGHDDQDGADDADDELREEVRQHVLARNARRVRAGDEPLDVEQEIVRRIRALS